MKRIVVIGGGTGTMAVLAALKHIPNVEISVIVSMTDDGGSNAVIRDEFGLLPLSDLRKSIIALSNSNNQLLRELFTYRFSKGDGLSGHTLGNLMMMALTDITGSERDAVRATSELFQVQGTVIPVTYNHTKLVAEYDDGTRIEGEHLIDEPEEMNGRHITKLLLSAPANASDEAVDAIRTADFIIAGPGDLYTSTLANIIVGGVAEAIAKSNAKFIFINNLMTKTGQTHGMTATDIVTEISRYATRMPDVVIVHAGTFPNTVLEAYKVHNEFPIVDDIVPSAQFSVIRADVVADQETEKDKGDTLVRSLIRHDAKKLRNVLAGLIG